MKESISEDLKSLEKRYWDALQGRDVATAVELTDEECIVVGAQGVGAVDHERLRQMLEQATYEVTHFELDDNLIRIRKITDDVAIIAYEVREDLIVDGKAESLQAFDASVWVKRGDNWLCTLHTESIKGDPFGRNDIDRMTEQNV